MRALVLVAMVGLAACVTARPVTAPPSADPIVEALTLDERGSSVDGILRWQAIALGAGALDSNAAALAVERIDAAIAEGVVDGPAETVLARLDAASLPGVVRPAIARARARLRRLAGDDAGATAMEHEAGCGLPWRVGGLVGRLPHVDLTHAPDAALAQPLSPAREAGCHVVGTTADGRPGAVPLVLDLSVDRTADLELDVSADSPYALWVDGVAGPRPDDRAPRIRVRRYRISVEAGAHRVVVTGAAVYGRFEAELALRAPRDTRMITAGVTLARARGTQIGERALPSARHGAESFVAAYLDAATHKREGDGVGARLAAERLLALAPRSAPALAIAARIADADGTVPSILAHDRARRLFERALEADPRAARVRYELGRLAIDRDRPRDALELAEAAPDRRALRAVLLYADVLRARGRDEEVRGALAAAQPADEQACSLVEAQLADDRLAHRPVVLTHARRLSRCHLGSTALGDSLREEGRNDEAIAEYRRVLSVDGLSENARASLGELLLAARRADEAVAAYQPLVEGARRSAGYRLRLCDALLAAGHADLAERTLDEGLALDPENAELVAAARALDRGKGRAEVDSGVDRIDGRAVMRAFEAAHRSYDGPAVFVLDRAVLRVFPTGAQRMITHNIVKVLSKEGIDRWGEWRIPEGAEVLTLCAWKPDGSRLEPEDITEKESISLPGLAAGDYVEVEYIERQSAPVAFPRGFLGERFFFASLEAPLDRSELILITPSEMPVDIDRRGEPPQAVIEERQEPQGKVTLRTFAARSVPQRFTEPSSAPLAEYMPSVRPRSHVSRDAWQDYLVDFAWGARRRDPVIAALATHLTHGAKDDREKLARIDAWVRARIEHGGGLDDPASAILARHEGNRVTALAALAEAAGMRTRILLARSRRASDIETDLESYDQPVVEVGGVVVDPRFRRGRPGELRPELRGVPALVLEPGVSHALATLPALEPGGDARDMKVQMELDADGSGRVRVEEALRGWPALEWREGLERLARDRVRPQFEQHTLGYYFPGAALGELVWEHEEEVERPFVVRYTLTAPSLARRSDDALVLPAPFAAQLLRRYASGKPRQSPVYADEVSPTSVELTVTLPEGVQAEPAPAVRLEGPRGALFEQRVAIDGRTLTMHSRFVLPGQRISLTEWPKFLAWITAIDRAEAALARVTRSAAGRDASTSPR